MRLRLSPPPEVKNKNDADVASVKQAFKARKATLSEVKRVKLDRRIRKMIEAHETGTASMRSKLQRINEFFEGKEDAVDFPFGPEASSKIDVRLAAGYARLLRAQFCRSVFDDPMHTYAMLDVPGFKREDLNKVERSVNWLAENRDNLNEALKDTFVPAYRDGTSLLHGKWNRRIERGCEYKQYANVQDFMVDYPDAEAAGVSETQYEEALQYLSGPDAVLYVEYQTDFVAANGPEFTVFPLAKFIFYPFYPNDVAKLRIYGYSYTESSGVFDHNAKYNYYDAKAVEVCKKKSPESRMNARASWDNQVDALEGLSDIIPDSVSYNLAWLSYADDLDEDGVEERYAVIYDLDKFRSLRVETYDLPRNVPCIIPKRLIRRTGRLLGASLLFDSEHLFREVNALHRHRSNTRRITDSVTLQMPIGVKDHVDLGAEYASFIPGMTMWVPDQYMNPTMSPRQFIVTGTSRTNESVDEEQFLQRYIDLLIGGSPGQSGRETPADPHAPASKTALLLSRADLRVEDLVDEWRRTIPQVVELYTALYVQNATSDIQIVSQHGEISKEENAPLDLFARPGLRGVLKPMKPSLTPETEMQKIAAIGMAAMKFMIPLQLKPDILVHIWNDYLAASRIDRPERYQIVQDEGGQMSMGGNPVQPGNVQGMLQSMLQGGQSAKNGSPGPVDMERIMGGAQ